MVQWMMKGGMSLWTDRRYIHVRSCYMCLFVILWYDSHTMRFTHLKCTPQSFLVYSLCGATITKLLISEHFITQKETQYPLAISPHCLLLQSKATTNLLSLSMDLPHWEISYEWITQYMAFCVCLAFFTWHNVFGVHLCCRMYQYPIPFLGPNNISCMGVLHFIHQFFSQLMDIWIDSIIWLL